MPRENLFDKILELKEKFSSFFQHRKKITALENFAEGDFFPHKHYLMLVKSCMDDGFLDSEESLFLDHMLKKYELNYLDWAHRTKWLKAKMEERKKALPVQQEEFSFASEVKTVPIQIPAHLACRKPYHRRAAM